MLDFGLANEVKPGGEGHHAFWRCVGGILFYSWWWLGRFVDGCLGGFWEKFGGVWEVNNLRTNNKSIIENILYGISLGNSAKKRRGSLS